MRGAAEEEEVEEMLRKVLEGACSKWIRRESHIDQTLVTQETSRDIQKHPETSRNIQKHPETTSGVSCVAACLSMLELICARPREAAGFGQ